LSIFVLGSLSCGLAPTWRSDRGARISGIRGGIALPLGVALLLRAFPVAEQGMRWGCLALRLS